MLYSKSTRFPCQGVLYRGTERARHKVKKRGGISRNAVSLYYSKKAKQPWLLVYRLPEGVNTPEKDVNLYRYRMQIEEGFRDTKSQQYGLGLAQARSKSTERYDNLLLIAALALFVLWCMGKVAVDKKYHYRLQANTTRHKAVLSYIYLAMQIVNDKRYKIKRKDLRIVLDHASQFTKSIDDIG